MKMSDAFPSNFLKAEDIASVGRDVIVTIAKVTQEVLGQGQNAERKFVIEFIGKEKKLVLNKTNFKACVAATGEDDSDNWPVKRISLFVMDVEYQGDLMPAIRVRPRAPAPAGAASQDRGTVPQLPPRKSAPAAHQQEDNTGGEDSGENVPF